MAETIALEHGCELDIKKKADEEKRQREAVARKKREEERRLWEEKRDCAIRLAGSRVPALVVWGTADKVFPVEQAKSLADAFQGATSLYLEGARHPAYLDATDAFHDALLEFVGQVGR